MNFQQLEYIIAVDRHKHFSRAAEYCNVTQATLSAMVKKLEDELGFVIFDRKTSPVITTEKGAEAIRLAIMTLKLSYAMKSIGESDKVALKGKVNIGVIPTVAVNLLPRILPGMAAAFPQLQPTFIELTSSELLTALKEGRIDLGIMATPVEDREIAENILYYEALLVYGSKDHEKRYLIPEDIDENNVWLLEEGHCLREQFIQLCSLGKHKKNMPFNFKANSFESLLNIIDQIGGLTLIPELYYMDLPENRKPKVQFFNIPIPVREISLVYHRPYARKNLIDALENYIKPIVAPTLLTQKYRNAELQILGI
jgi:LysR family hydrogen peroxide-inducible transcriptional activator